MKDGGRGGIRTHGTVARTSDFESGAFNHSATLPVETQQLTTRHGVVLQLCNPILYPTEAKIQTFLRLRLSLLGIFRVAWTASSSCVFKDRNKLIVLCRLLPRGSSRFLVPSTLVGEFAHHP
jgi:hypothetical protein